MKAERQKVRLNNTHPKEDASTFTQTRQRRLSLFNLFQSFFLLFPLNLQILLPPLSLPVSPSPHSLFMCSLLSSPFLPISLFPPRATVSDPDTFVSLSLCHNFKQRQRSGHADVPGASVTVPSQVYVSQRVLDDTLSLSPILLLLISVVSSGGIKDS